MIPTSSPATVARKSARIFSGACATASPCNAKLTVWHPHKHFHATVSESTCERKCSEPGLPCRNNHSIRLRSSAVIGRFSGSSPFVASTILEVYPCMGFVSKRGRCLEIQHLAQTPSLHSADRNLTGLLIVHLQLISRLEPWHYFANPVDVHHKRPVRTPERIRI